MSETGLKRLRVGIVGLQPGRSWGAVAHVPALRALKAEFEIVGVANTSKESGEAAAAATSISRAFSDVAELVASPDVDVVAVTVKVPHHASIVKAALAAGKHVYCEWPLGNGLAEAEAMAALAKTEGRLRAVIGTQAVVAPEVEYLQRLIADGYVGRVLSTSIVASGMAWGPVLDKANAYIADARNGATMLTIPFGHTLAAVQAVLGRVVEVSARQASRRTSFTVAETGETLPMTSPDQLLVHGLLEGGAPISVHYRGGMPRGTGLLWEINGTEGDIQVTAANGHTQLTQLTLLGARGEDKELKKLDVPAEFSAGAGDFTEAVPRNVARMYARMAADLRDGTTSAPTFDDAVALHRLIAAIEASHSTGGASVRVEG
jgi:predicted dehydrogenase